eukprot:CAMPEP_0119414666 /NCGR_PEP_ID=MMETSP1335-20130426/7113_1 /TAXON_ID=259385 /ORGANISM="Chrysoculter rhomboideus, Strain RCC1486" /LENGTH=298 /DNA_ID=CAMNT_0007439553 /DNA_START=18 /DNA_END=914 /DNA_ORIENTATION=-
MAARNCRNGRGRSLWKKSDGSGRSLMVHVLLLSVQPSCARGGARNLSEDSRNADAEANRTYAPTGRTVVLGVGSDSSDKHLRVYIAGHAAKFRSKAVVLLYDASGWNERGHGIFRVADQLAANGFVVAMADHFRGLDWAPGQSPPASTGTVREDLLDTLMPYLEDEYEASVVGLMGLGWGGQHALRLASAREHLGAVVVVDGASLEVEAAVQARVPVAVYAAGEGPSVALLRGALSRAPAASSCEVSTFAGRSPGFVVGDWSDGDVATDAAEALNRTNAFFRAHLNIFHAELFDKDEL